MVCASTYGNAMIIFSCLRRTVSMHFDGLFDCSKGKGKYRREGAEGRLLTSVNKSISDDPF